MNDQQLLTLAIAIVVPLSMLLYSNSRITEAAQSSNSRITEAKETLRAEMALGFERLGNKIDHLAGEVATLKELLSSHLREHHGVK